MMITIADLPIGQDLVPTTQYEYVAYSRYWEEPVTDKTSKQIADEEALKRYFELIPKRVGDLNDYTKGTYQIVYDPAEIASLHQEVFERLYKKAKDQGMSDSKASQLAADFSRPGIVCEDHFWVWVRDPVISPTGHKHTYNRMIWKSSLDGTGGFSAYPGGAAALPMIVDGNEKKFALILTFRHATGAWELEVPRGGRNRPDESPEEIARREIQEEAGFVVNNMVYLGGIAPDSGLVSSVVPVFIGEVIAEKETSCEETEAIKGRYVFTFKELVEGLKRGSVEINIDEKPTQVFLRDPFLAYALLMIQSD